MKRWIIRIVSISLLIAFVFSGCLEPRYYHRDRDDDRYHQRHHRHHDRDNRNDRD